MNEPNPSKTPKPSKNASFHSWLLRISVSIICGLVPMFVFDRLTGGPSGQLQIAVIIGGLYTFIFLSGIADYYILHLRGRKSVVDSLAYMVGFTVVMTIITAVAGIGACFANLKL